MNDTRAYGAGLVIGLGFLLLALCFVSLLVGAGTFGIRESLGYFFNAASTDSELTLVVETLRAPRTGAAILVGALLGVAGSLLQTITRNPLAEPGLLGINAGAALAVVVGMTYAGVETGMGYLVWAFIGALVGSGLVLSLAHAKGGGPDTPLRLILAGVALGSSFSGLTAILLLGHQASLDQYRFWVLGSLSGIRPDMLWSVIPAGCLALSAALWVRRPLGALSLGDDVARALGYRLGWIRCTAAIAVTLAAGASVALAGPIAFVGLLAPHAARALAGHAPGLQLLLSALVGAVLLLIADMVAREVIQPYEVPVSIIVAFAGAPLMIVLVHSRRLFSLSSVPGGPSWQ